MKCVLTTEARAKDCTVVKSLSPALDQLVVEWLGGSTWNPVTLEGKPVQVHYIFTFRLSPPPRAPPDGGTPPDAGARPG